MASERIEAGMLALWREDADKVERWMNGAKSTYDRRVIDLVKAVRKLTDEVERLYAATPAPSDGEPSIRVSQLGDFIAALGVDAERNQDVRGEHRAYLDGKLAALAAIQLAFPPLISYAKSLRAARSRREGVQG